jgi:hypothetical protein
VGGDLVLPSLSEPYPLLGVLSCQPSSFIHVRFGELLRVSSRSHAAYIVNYRCHNAVSRKEESIERDVIRCLRLVYSHHPGIFGVDIEVFDFCVRHICTVRGIGSTHQASC